MSTAWIILFIAGLLEAGWALGLKASNGFSRPLTSLFTVLAMILSFYLLAQAMKSLPVGTAYAIWVGIGAIGTVLLGIFFYGDSANPLRLASLTLILTGLVGLKLAS
ncbi:quaternary ammonium compound efflux SMR transporter SugE [Halomonas nitroreducens]|uniref:Guanidinium exporter n=1 Tax=Halomonas nitroreducens TaxID=447425 RepID=A0A3S0HSA1_9GAMM|nr:quaternary ammonium compound efflux SMR transporter SugE [Halomonas nitroreducens]RTR02987.1 quaternary ammonium compound efflux SMR transporter SugE [Halomonas nitroreducens]